MNRSLIFLRLLSLNILSLVTLTSTQNSSAATTSLTAKDNESIVIIGAGMASRMMKYSHFETEIQLRYPDKNLTIRNIADEGNTPVFRPHPGRSLQLAFKGAEQYYPNHESGKSGPWTKGAVGNFETPDQWLTRLKADTVIAFFGFNSAHNGEADLERFKKELAAFIDHTLSQKYNGNTPPQLALVSPTAIQDLSATHHTPDGKDLNNKLALYTKAMADICQQKGIIFIDVFAPSKAYFSKQTEPLTVDGALLNSKGYQWLARQLADDLYGKTKVEHAENISELVHAAVKEKNWVWHNLYKIPNGVHVYGRRHRPFGPQNYPDELIKLAEMTELRDKAIWKALKGEKTDYEKEDALTHQLKPIPTNYKPSKKNGETRYLSGQETIKHLTLPDGYKIQLFADEAMFPELANPVQMSFDSRGRLWVGCMPSYPHWRPGDPKPNDSLLIFEDTDNDGVADKRTIFADDLHLCIGFEITDKGVIVSQADSIILLTDTDGDDQYDTKEYLLSGFDDHDTHHAISAFCADPSGAIYMGEGVFLHSNVESVYGTHRGTNGGHFRYNPKRHHLERTTQLQIPNPWGTTFDQWGQPFFLHTSDTRLNWMTPGTVKPRYGHSMTNSVNLLTSNNVRPTSGIEIVSSRHFPDEVQGDILLCNTINFLGIKQHQKEEDGTGYKLTYRQDLLKSSEGNFRPVDLEFAPDGSLYLLDWSNVLIGHMQHSARDPKRDHVHGRIYRITYPSRPLIPPVKIHGASIDSLLDNLKHHEDRTRYRTRRELRARDTAEVLTATAKWIASLDQSDPNYEHHLLEAMWVTWGHDQVNQELVRELLKSKDHRVRAAATRAVRYNRHQMEDHVELLKTAAADPHGRVRLEALTAASWLPKSEGLAILDTVEKTGVDPWLKDPITYTRATLEDINIIEKVETLKLPTQLAGNKEAIDLYKLGHEVYMRDAHCATCHQENGLGLPDGGFPPIAQTKWVNEDPERLIKLTLKGLMGPVEVKGKQYNGVMTAFEGLLNDKEVAAVLTYVRNTFGNNASIITPDQVRKVRAETKDLSGFLNADELLKKHPHAPPKPKVFIPAGGTAHLIAQPDIDLFTKGKDIGNVQNNPKLPHRRLVQRTMMPTEKRPSYGATLTFDDQLVADSPSLGSAIDIVKDLAPLNARAIFFANVPMVSGKSVNGIMSRNKTSEKRLAACEELLESKRSEFIKIIRELIRIKSAADENGNAEYACDVYNHTAFHQNMSRLTVESDRYKMCIMGIEFIEECLDEAYRIERPNWNRARYFRFPFLHDPDYRETKTALNQTFTELGLICLGETQDSKDFDNYSANMAYAALKAAKQNKRYNPKYGKYGETEKPIALFHTKTWPKIKSGVIKAIKEK